MIGLVLVASLAAAPLQVIQSANADGQRVRVVARSDTARPIVGVLGGAQNGRFDIRVTKSGTTVSVAPGDVAQLSVSRGANTRAGARNGFLVGLGIGAIVFAATLDENSRAEGFGLDVPLAAIAYFGLLPLPFALGGALLAGERWEPMAAPVQQGADAGAGPTVIRFAASERVRAMTATGMRTGAVARATQDSLLLVTGDRMAWRDVTTLSVLGGRSRATGAVVGGLVGLAVGIAATVGSPSPDAGANAGGMVLTTAGGAILGARFLPFSRWMPLPVPK